MKLTNQQGFCLMTAFLLGNVLSGIGGMGHEPKTGYLGIFISYGIYLVFVAMYHFILKRNGYRGFFHIIKNQFGPNGQKPVLIVIAVSAFLSAFFSISNYMNFIFVSTYQKTPVLPCLIFVLLLILYLCLSREKTMGRYSEIVLPIVFVAIITLLCFGLSHWNSANLQTDISITTIVKQGAFLFLGPFSEMVFFYLVSECLQSPKSISKIAVFSGATVTVIFSLIYLFNLSVLGEQLMADSKFPTFTAASVIPIGTVIEKAETLITFSYSFCDILYSSVCLFVCQKSLGILFSMKQKTKKITAFSAVIFIGLLWFLLKQKITLETVYPIATILLMPLTTGLPILMLLFSIKSPKDNHQYKSSCSKKL